MQWRTTDLALRELHERIPGFGPTATLLKVVAINALYGTNVLAVGRAARHVQTVLESADLANVGSSMVETLASIPTTPNAKPRRYISFASKFAHFFCSADRFPIYDSYAQRTLLLHLGPKAVRDPKQPYEAFMANLEMLKQECGLSCSHRELDRYLWIAGLYRAYEKGSSMLNAELRRLFDQPSADQRALLETLRGESRHSW